MWRRFVLSAVLMMLIAVAPGCGDDDSADDSFTLGVDPQFVQGVIPGALTGVLVSIDDEGSSREPVVITATAEGATVTVEPAEVAAGVVAEVWLVADEATAERPIEIVVTGRRGEREVVETRSTTVMAWDDDRVDEAGALLAVFLGWLEENRPELGITAESVFEGSFVAPGLLVVSHYLFLSNDWELGLSWHVMVPPDDWAEIYLRPRHGPEPTVAFRLVSQAGALVDGVVDVMEVMAPMEVVR